VVTVSNVLYRKTQSSGVARRFDWGDQKHGYLALIMNLKKYSQSGAIFLQWPMCPPWLCPCSTEYLVVLYIYSKGRVL